VIVKETFARRRSTRGIGIIRKNYQKQRHKGRYQAPTVMEQRMA